MKAKLLSNITELMYAQHFSEVTETDLFWKIVSPHNPTYFWGNCLIMKEAPQDNDYQAWVDIYNAEFKDHHLFKTIAWDDAFVPDLSEFMKADFEFIHDHVLVLSRQKDIGAVNDDLQIRYLDSDADWNQFHEVRDIGAQFTVDFVTRQAKAFRHLVDKGVARRYGAFDGTKLMGDIGIFFDDQHVRFHNVATRKDCRRQGVCKSIMKRVLDDLGRDFAQHRVVIVADPGSVAEKIYRNFGFEVQEQTYQLQWFDREHFA